MLGDTVREFCVPIRAVESKSSNGRYVLTDLLVDVLRCCRAARWIEYAEIVAEAVKTGVAAQHGTESSIDHQPSVDTAFRNVELIRSDAKVHTERRLELTEYDSMLVGEGVRYIEIHYCVGERAGVAVTWIVHGKIELSYRSESLTVQLKPRANAFGVEYECVIYATDVFGGQLAVSPPVKLRSALCNRAQRQQETSHQARRQNTHEEGAYRVACGGCSGEAR
jgi:hypothetical protein